MDNYSLTPLWAVPLYVSSVNIPQDIKQQLCALNYERIEADNGEYTVDKYVLDKFPTLKSAVQQHVERYLRDIIEIVDNNELVITTSWVVKHAPNDFSHSHVHVNSIVSGCVYLNVDDNSGDIVFEKEWTHNNMFTSTINPDVKQYNIFNSGSWLIKPKNNDIVIFPSQIRHSVKKNCSNNYRYSLAFNVFVKGVMGSQERELFL